MVYRMVAKLADVVQDYPLRVRVEGRDIALFNLNGQIFATDNICSHEYASLADGVVDGETVECPLHGACFEIRTGRALTPPASVDIKTYGVQIKDGDILVGLPDEPRSGEA